MSFTFLVLNGTGVRVVSWGPPTVLACLVKGSVSEWYYALAHLMASGVRGGTLVVPMANMPAVKTAVLYHFGKLALSDWQRFDGEEWCRAVAVVFERGWLVMWAMKVASGVVVYLGCGNRENFNGGGVHIIEWCGVGWSDGFLW